MASLNSRFSSVESVVVFAEALLPTAKIYALIMSSGYTSADICVKMPL